VVCVQATVKLGLLLVGQSDLLRDLRDGIPDIPAKLVFSDPLHLSRLDQRFIYFEERWITLGTIESEGGVAVANMIFDGEGEEVIRIISVRRATRREANQYGR
jgi:uncharacterized protein